jgi:hypothetical protein
VGWVGVSVSKGERREGHNDVGFGCLKALILTVK